MSLIRAKAIQMGYDATASNNFLIYQPLTPDGTFRIANGNQGATTDIMTVSSAGNVTFAGSTNFASLNFGSGTESAPSLYPTGDTNTGVWFPAADTFAVSTSGTERIRVTSAGILGIGTATPNADGGVTLSKAPGTNAAFEAVLPGVAALAVGYNGKAVANAWGAPAGTGYLWLANNFALTFGTNASERMRISSAGNVGIATAAPANKLSVGDGSADTRGVFWPNNAFAVGVANGSGFGGWIGAAATDTMVFSSSGGSERMRIDSTGNVGIGTNNPSAHLDVWNTGGTANSVQSILAHNPYDTGFRLSAYSGASSGSASIQTSLRMEYGTSENASINFWRGSGPTNGFLSFNVNGGTEAIRIDSNGSVGIGTIPANKLHVVGSSNNTISSSTFNCKFEASGGNGIGIGTLATSPYTSYIQSGYVSNIGVATYALALNPVGGAVGVGTTSPTATLDVRGGIAVSGWSNNNGGTAGGIEFGWDGVQALLQSYNRAGNAYTPVALNGSYVRALVSGSEAFRVHSNGSVRIGSGSQQGTDGWGTLNVYATGGDAINIKHTVNGNHLMNLHQDGTMTSNFMYFVKNGGGVGSITCSTTGTTYNTSSDYRLKENVKPMQNALDTVIKLNPVTYTWKVDGSAGQGFIAHELQEHVPDAVTGEKDAVKIVEIKDEDDNVIGTEEQPVYQGIDTSFLVATLTKAIQEQQEIIESLKARLDAAGL